MASQYKIVFFLGGGGRERIGYPNKGKRDQIEVIGGWKGQWVQQFGHWP